LAGQLIAGAATPGHVTGGTLAIPAADCSHCRGKLFPNAAQQERGPRMRRMLLWALLLASSALLAQTGGELRFCIRSEPKTFNPLLVEDDASETVRYLTGGVLLRVNRITQKPQPELATSWKVFEDGKRIRFTLRTGIRYSDGT